MSVVLKHLNKVAQTFDGKTVPKDAFKAHFENAARPSYGMPEDLEVELKYCSNAPVSEIAKELETLFSPKDRHDSSRDGFFVVDNSAEQNQYYLTSLQIDTLTKDDQGIVTNASEIELSGHQLRLRLGFYPHNVLARSNNKQSDAQNYTCDNPLEQLGASHIYGIPEISAKTLHSKSDNQSRLEFEVVLEDNDYIGTLMRGKEHNMSENFKEVLTNADEDKNTELCTEALCMTRRVMFYGVHYLADKRAYVGFECTIDSNLFADAELDTDENSNDRELEFEVDRIFPSDGRPLTVEERKEIVKASKVALNDYILENTQSFKESWGSKMERASQAALKLQQSKAAKANNSKTDEFNKSAGANVHPCLLLEQDPADILEHKIGDLFRLSQMIPAPLCETNSVSWLKEPRKRAAFFANEHD